MVHVFEYKEGRSAEEVAFVGSGKNNFFELDNIRMINLLQQSNLWNNHYDTSQSSYRKTLLLQFCIVILEFLYGVKLVVLQPSCLEHRSVSASTDFFQYLIVLFHIVSADECSAFLSLSSLSHSNRIKW